MIVLSQTGPVHAFLECRNLTCNYIYDYIRKNIPLYICTLPGSFTWNAIRLRLRRKRKKGTDIKIEKREKLGCPKCGSDLWVFELPPRSATSFERTFDEAIKYYPRDMLTEEEIETREEDFKEKTLHPVQRYLDIDNPPSDTYRNLVDEINICFHYQAYSATIVMVRKIVENLIVDLLRQKYGTNGISLYYLVEQRRFRNLSELISNLRSRIDDFDIFGLRRRHLDIFEKLREAGNADVHSVIDQSTKEDLMELQSIAQKAVKILLTVRELLFGQ